jgi:diadenosine tetraphosphate (Ap4A) HIT family hydrolase
MTEQKEFLQKSDRAIEGFNIGINCGEVAGQTIFHCHVHLIPRRSGDVENPRGGVRHVITGKGYY